MGVDRFDDRLPCCFKFACTIASAIISVMPKPILWQPSHSPYVASNITCTKPSGVPLAITLPDGENGNLPIHANGQSGYLIRLCLEDQCVEMTQQRGFLATNSEHVRILYIPLIR